MVGHYISRQGSVSSWIARAGTFFLTYRFPVYILTFLLIVGPLRLSYVLVHPEVVIVALCFSSLMAFIYLFNKVTDHIEDSINVHGQPVALSARNPVLVVSIVCLVIPLAYLVVVPAYLPWYLTLAALGYFYSKPLPFTNPPLRLKGVLIIKNITAALGWAIPSSGIYSVIIPGYTPTDFWIHFGALFCFSLMVELLWDVRDMEGDRVAGVHTVANTFGVRVTRALAVVLLGGFLLLLGVGAHPYLSLFVAALSLAFIFATNPQRKAGFYHAIFAVWISALTVLFFT